MKPGVYPKNKNEVSFHDRILSLAKSTRYFVFHQVQSIRLISYLFLVVVVLCHAEEF